jgi:uncharacterized protein YcbK (DUF882 family)
MATGNLDMPSSISHSALPSLHRRLNLLTLYRLFALPAFTLSLSLLTPAHAAGPHSAGSSLSSVETPTADPGLTLNGRRYELKLHSAHTGESLNIVYRIGDTYIPEALDKLNHFLRDRRTEEESTYDPAEFDLLHDLMTRLHRPGLIDVVCGYRTPETNEFLRTRGRNTGVARNSQHIQAKAIDIRIPGIRTKTIRDAALSLGLGGVGYYPRSQFVHVDVGPVRKWSYFGRSSD